MRAEFKDQTCEYYGSAGLSAQLARQESASVMERAKTQSSDPKINAMEVQRMLNQIGAANGNSEAGPADSHGELPLLVLSVSPNGKATMNGLNIAKVPVGGVGKASTGQGEDPKSNAIGDVFVGASVDGVGDKAMCTPKSGLHVLRGDTILQVNPGVFPGYNNKCVAVARAILPKW